MLFEDKFDVTFQQVGQFQYIIVVKVEGKTFTAPIQCNGMNETMAHEVWRTNYRQFFHELDVDIIQEKDIIKV